MYFLYSVPINLPCFFLSYMLSIHRLLFGHCLVLLLLVGGSGISILISGCFCYLPQTTPVDRKERQEDGEWARKCALFC